MKSIWNLAVALWDDCDAVVISTELALVSSILVVAIVASLSRVYRAVRSELNDVARVVDNIDQSYGYTGIQSHSAFTAGSAYYDAPSCITLGR